jgi:hypothetical protein
MPLTWPRSGVQKFGRIFWAFGPSIERWKYCRLVVSVNDTHLYGNYEGHALTPFHFCLSCFLFLLASQVSDRRMNAKYIISVASRSGRYNNIHM